MTARTLARAAELAGALDGVTLAPGWHPYAGAELWPAQLTGRGRAVALMGPGGRRAALPLWQWRAILSGRRRVLYRDARTGRLAVLVLSDVLRSWRPLYTFDPRRAAA